MAFGVSGVHAEQVGSEERRLLAAGAGAHLQDDVALVIRVARDEQRPKLVGKRRLALLEERDLLAGHGAHFLVGVVGHLLLVPHVPRFHECTTIRGT